MTKARGCYRRVLLLGNYAIKFPDWSWGIEAFFQAIVMNLRESRLWKETKNKDLCPVIFKFPLGLFIIMKRVRVLTDKEYSDNEHLICEDGSFLPLGEKKPSSFGFLDNNLVVIDYGD